MVKTEGVLVPPLVVVSVTLTLAGATTIPDVTGAVHSPVLMYVVESAVPFQLITQLES